MTMSTRREFFKAIVGTVAALATAPLLRLVPVHRCGVIVSNRWLNDEWEMKVCGHPAIQMRMQRWGMKAIGEDFYRRSSQWRCDEHAQAAGWHSRFVREEEKTVA
jgi:hypothetical protein